MLFFLQGIEILLKIPLACSLCITASGKEDLRRLQCFAQRALDKRRAQRMLIFRAIVRMHEGHEMSVCTRFTHVRKERKCKPMRQ